MTFIGLDLSGLIGAVIVGGIVLGVGGWPGAAVLFAFFIPSTLLSRLGRARKRALVDIAKTGARDGWQVAANGGVAAVAMLLSIRFGAPMLAAFAGAFAAASADTWGTEIGTLVRGEPRNILNLRRIPTGLSGGVTWQGTLAQCAGAVFVAAIAASLHVAPFLTVAIAGFCGALVDSILGASAQALLYCPACERDCETNPHHCGAETIRRRGFGWLENDAVNFAATLSGALVALAIYAL